MNTSVSLTDAPGYLLHIFRNFSTHLPNLEAVTRSSQYLHLPCRCALQAGIMYREHMDPVRSHLTRKATSVAMSSVNIHLLASCSDCISDYQAGAIPILEVTERTPAAGSGPFGHLGFLEGHVLAFMYRLQGRRESGRLCLPVGSALWDTRTSCVRHCKLT